MNEKPLERLNYYNGQSLDAPAFKTEQDYHIRTRRWLNKSLYSAGIARGLDVRAITEGPKKDAPFVAVGPGLALDSEGREIILLEEATVEVCSYAGTEGSDGTVVGNYLVIEYAEEAISFERGGCAVRATGTSASRSTAPWGGPSRIQAQVKFSWVPFVPPPGSNQIVLARVELAKGCRSVYQIDVGARRYIGAATAAMVKQYALEGEREVACLPELDNAGRTVGQISITARIFFHVRSRQPNGVTLYLKAEELSKLHYTEMGHHQHTVTVGAEVSTSSPIYDMAHPEKYTHSHTLNSLSAKAIVANESNHKHTVLSVTFRGSHTDGEDRVLTLSGRLPLETPVYDNILPSLSMPNGRVTGYGGPIGTDAILGAPFTAVVEGATGHTHALTGTTDDKETKVDHTHTLTPSVDMASAGVTDPSSNHSYSARVGSPLSIVHNLQIAIDGVEKTIAIRDQIVDSVPGSEKPAWQLGLGNGTDTHPLANRDIDAVPIRLDFLPGVTFSEGQHVIEFSVSLAPNGAANGGKILYNLYIE